MATVSTALRMFDQMTNPLQQVTQALNLTISAMNDMNNSANRDIRITNTLNTARESISRASAGLQELVSSQDRARNSQENLNNSFNRGSSSTDSLAGKVKNLVGAYIGFQTIKKGIDLTIGGASRLEQQLITISGMLGNKEVGKQFFGDLNDYANISVYGLKEFSGITRQFIQFTKNTDKLMDLNKTAERLAFLDPTQGLEGAGFALKEALGGDFMSLKGRFGFGSADREILQSAESMEDFISKFNELLDKKGATEQALEEFNNSAIAQFNNLKSNIETSFAQAGEKAMEALKPLLSTLNEAFREGKFEPFFDGIAIGLGLISDGLLGIIDIFNWIGQTVQNNWSIIQPILIAILLYFLVMLIPTIWNTITSLVAMAIAWIMVNWPIMLVIGAIALFIYILMKCGVTAEQITGFIGGVFGVLYATVYNIIAMIWNRFASLGEFLANLFIDPTYAIKKLLYDLAVDALGFIGSIAKGLTDLVNMIPGVKIDLYSGIDNLIDKIPEPKSDKNVVKFKRMELKDYSQEATKGYNKGANFATGIGDIFGGMGKVPYGPPEPPVNLDAWNNAQTDNFGGVDDSKDANKHLKNIDDKIDVSNEHLEMLRDLAEQDSIQNFVSLTPTVQVTTGDIKEEADINKIISKIEDYMENELVNSAEGMYA